MSRHTDPDDPGGRGPGRPARGRRYPGPGGSRRGSPGDSHRRGPAPGPRPPAGWQRVTGLRLSSLRARAPRAGGAPRARAPRAGRAGIGGPRRWLLALGPHPALKATAIVATVVMVGASLTAYAFYRSVYDSIHHETVTSQMLGKRPPKFNGSLNVLVIGSDSRKGSHGKYGRGIYGSRSDTSMLLHISPTHKRALVVSFPRDSMVPVYRCLPDGQGHMGQQAAPGQFERLNATFSYGGAPCLWKTLEQTSGIRIDHFVEVDFSGFKAIVNDVGGVSVCLPFAINDPASGLHLSAGRHTVNGTQALAFVRERHIGYGSDLQRIQRQQYFLAAAMQKIKQTDVLSDPTRIYSVVHDAARSLTTDSGLNLTTMVAIADSMKSLSASALRFISLPVVPYPADPGAEVEWAQPGADKLFHAIAHDTSLPKKHKAKKGKKGKNPAPSVSPSQVQVDVLNGSGTPLLASKTGTQLTSLGFNVTGTGDASSFGYTSSVIEYGSSSQLGAVSTLKAHIPGAQVKQVAGLQSGSLTLILGSSFNGVSGHQASSAAPRSTSKSKSKSKSKSALDNVGKTYGGISGSANICHDSSAFQGPDNPSMFAP